MNTELSDIISLNKRFFFGAKDQVKSHPAMVGFEVSMSSFQTGDFSLTSTEKRAVCFCGACDWSLRVPKIGF